MEKFTTGEDIAPSGSEAAVARRIDPPKSQEPGEAPKSQEPNVAGRFTDESLDVPGGRGSRFGVPFGTAADNAVRQNCDPEEVHEARGVRSVTAPEKWMHDLDVRSSICFLDTETTGLSVFHDRVIEIGLACFSGAGAEIGRWSAFIDAGVEVKNSEIHGITKQMTKESGIALSAALDVLMTIAGGVRAFAGHNFEGYDLPILVTEAMRIGHPFAGVLEAFPRLDTLSLARGRRIAPATLENVCRATFAGPGFKAAHHALDDAVDCARCFFWLREHPEYVMTPRASPPTGDECLSVGKHKGKTFAEIRDGDPDFCAWVRRKSEGGIKSEPLMRFRSWLAL